MPRISKADARRKELIGLVAEAFSGLGCRRATTAEIPARCGVQENILYRLWLDNKAMFVAAIEFLFWRRMEKWKLVLEKAPQKECRVPRLIELTGKNLGEQGFYRIIFSALSETDDPDVKQSLQRLYGQYYDLLRTEISRHREQRRVQGMANA